MPQFIFRPCPWTRNFTKLIVFKWKQFWNSLGEVLLILMGWYTFMALSIHTLTFVLTWIFSFMYPDFFTFWSKYFYNTFQVKTFSNHVNRCKDGCFYYSLLTCTLRMCMSQLMAPYFPSSICTTRFWLIRALLRCQSKPKMTCFLYNLPLLLLLVK